MSAHATPRVKMIRRCLYAALTGGILAFACSMSIFLGYLSFFLTPIMLAFTLIFSVTLLFTSSQNKLGTRPNAGKHQLPSLARKPTMIAAYAIAAGWLAAFGVIVYFLVDFYKLEPSERQWNLKGLTVAEAILAVSNAGVMILTGVLCASERKEAMGVPSRNPVQLGDVGRK